MAPKSQVKNRRKAQRTRLQRLQQAHHPNKLLFIVTPSGLTQAAFFGFPEMAFLLPASLLKMLRKQFFTELHDSKKLIPLKETE
jgi:hypothetical protein